MRKQKSVLILGAGASKVFGLPLGSELKEKIANDLRILFDDFGTRLSSGSHEIVDALRTLVANNQAGIRGDINPHRAVAVLISQAMGPSGSIDEYVERHRNDPKYAECAKLAIAKAILEGEKNSSIYLDHQISNEGDELLHRNSTSWLSLFLRDITRRLDRDEIADAFSNLDVINFNYDRCFEHFSYHWIKGMYNFSEEETRQICETIRIYHPYGKLGDLPYQNPRDHIAFGGKVYGERLVSIASNIRTYSETSVHAAELDHARSAIAGARNVVFLGFGFHEQNMDLISTAEFPDRSSIRCYATIKGISSPRIEINKENIRNSFKVNSTSGLFFEGVSGTCEEFWSEYGDVVCR